MVKPRLRSARIAVMGCQRRSAQNHARYLEKRHADVIFTVITSPIRQSEILIYMPETFTSSAGVTFKRPLLAAEATTGAGKR